MTAASSTPPLRWGVLTFVGAGPGDPQLLTVAGAQAIAEAELVICDLDLDCSAFAAITTADVVSVDADEFQQLQSAITAGVDVVRLVRGDLFAEAESLAVLATCLATPGMRVDVIPGVGRRTAVGSYLGFTSSPCGVFVDARKPIGTWPQADSLFIRSRGKRLATIASEANRPEDESLLLVKDAGLTTQTSERVTWAELASIDVRGEVYLLAGPAVERRTDLDWFTAKPLLDWRVLIPQTQATSEVLVRRLAVHGALPEEVPTVSIEPPRTEGHMEKAVRGIVDGRYGWVVFTSPNAVQAIRDRIEEFGLDARAISGVRIAAVSDRTVRALAKWGLNVDLGPQGDPHTAASMADHFPAHDDMIDPIDKVLVPRADISIDPLLNGLAGIGWDVEDVVAYRTVRAAPPPAETREAIKTGLFDAVAFGSVTAVRNLIGIAGKPHAATVIAAAGPATARACEEHGLRVDVVAADPSPRALADALADFAADRRDQFQDKGLAVSKPSARKRRKYKRRATAS